MCVGKDTAKMVIGEPKRCAQEKEDEDGGEAGVEREGGKKFKKVRENRQECERWFQWEKSTLLSIVKLRVLITM